MTIEVSNGEALDKLSILEIKLSFSKSKQQSENIKKEYDYLRKKITCLSENYHEYYVSLKEVNLELWEIEDSIRKKEKERDFGAYFISLARSVYIVNDKRSRIKKKINELSSSVFVEEKIYE